jgi:hypothetical protein
MIDKDDIIAEHLPYEIDMLRYAYQRLPDLQKKAEINVFIECFCVHARNLLDFFWDGRPEQKNYAVARQFTSGSYSPFSGKNPKADGLYGKLNDQIVHVTYGRIDITEQKIGDEERAYLKNLIGREIDNFGGHLAAAYRHLWTYKGESPIEKRNAIAIGATGPIDPTSPRRSSP